MIREEPRAIVSVKTVRETPPAIANLGAYYSLQDAAEIASLFDLPKPIAVHDFPDKGNIHQDTFIVTAGPRGYQRDYLLQRINQQVFTQPRRTMAAMLACIEAQNINLTTEPLPAGEEWHVIDLVPTLQGDPFLEYAEEAGVTFWRLMVLIPGCRTFKSLGEIGDPSQRLHIAEQAGRGLALYSRLTKTMDASSLHSPLPGYRDTRLYYDQLLSVLQVNRTPDQAAGYLPEDPIVRHSTEQHFLVHIPMAEYRRRSEDAEVRAAIELALEQREYGLSLMRGMELGEIRSTAIHGDTKLDNFLFCAQSGRVKAVVDLDTIMPHTWLSDWGDMVRSLVNVAGEKEPVLDRVQVDLDVYGALARGFLAAAGDLPAAEVALMADAVQIIALELGIRFLADYLRGDSYFKLGPADPPDLNRTRALVQLTLFDRLRSQSEAIRTLLAP